MKSKLIKKGEHFYSLILFDNKEMLATTEDAEGALKLSLKNCQAIERGYDLDKMSSHWRWYYSDTVPEYLRDHLKNSYESGFQKALEILGDNKFTIEEMSIAFNQGIDYAYTSKPDPSKYIESLQQTEWDVEVMIDICGNKVYAVPELRLDDDGCLVLKPIKK